MTDTDLDTIRCRLAPLERTAWLPELSDGDAPGRWSRLGGAAALVPGETWPRCGNCAAPMPLFLQLAEAELPEAFAGALAGGVLQLFYCTSTDPACESVCQAFFPHARSTLLRLVPAGVLTTAANPVALGFPGRAVTNWTPTTDLPGWQEAQALGVELSDDQAEALADGDLPRAGEKLGGWPLWVQGVEYPACRRCGQTMRLLFQLDSEQGIPWMFGDAGIGHVTQCPTHLDEFAFGWACC